MSRNVFNSSSASCRGMTLIEVLIAAVVIGIGLLGVAALQVSAIRGSSDADFRSRAVDITSSLADRMRANLQGVVDNAYLSTTAANCATPPEAVCAMTPNAEDANGVTECSTSQMAAFDLWEVRCRNGAQTSLPDGLLTVACSDAECSPLSPLIITVSWQAVDPSAANAGEAAANENMVVTTVIPGAP